MDFGVEAGLLDLPGTRAGAAGAGGGERERRRYGVCVRVCVCVCVFVCVCARIRKDRLYALKILYMSIWALLTGRYVLGESIRNVRGRRYLFPLLLFICSGLAIVFELIILSLLFNWRERYC